MRAPSSSSARVDVAPLAQSGLPCAPMHMRLLTTAALLLLSLAACKKDAPADRDMAGHDQALALAARAEALRKQHLRQLHRRIGQ